MPFKNLGKMRSFQRVPVRAVAILFISCVGCAKAANVLLIDDSYGQPVQAAWTSALSSLGHNVAVESIPNGGNPTVNLASYDLVIWTVGDRAYNNLTVGNWSTMTQYVSSGGKLIYAGGHSVYEEFLVGHAAIESFFGVTNTLHNMPMWGSNTTIVGTGNSPTFGTASYTIPASWTGGQYQNMFSGFGVSSATALVNQPILNGGSLGPYVVAQNSANSAQLWGLDLNHIAPADRQVFLSNAIQSLAIPEPSALVVSSVGLVMILARRKRIKQPALHARDVA